VANPQRVAPPNLSDTGSYQIEFEQPVVPPVD
jgi:hypothetical protein